MKILIVDDSRAMRAIISRIIRKLGHETLEASNGRQALEVCRASPDLGAVLIDWNMPFMNGLELVKALRADPTLADVVLLMVTSESEIERVAEALEAGADEYLMKPFTEEDLASKLDLAVSARDTRRNA